MAIRYAGTATAGDGPVLAVSLAAASDKWLGTFLWRPAAECHREFSPLPLITHPGLFSATKVVNQWLSSG